MVKEVLIITALVDSFYVTISANDLKEFILENRVKKVKRRKTFFIRALGLPSSYVESKELDAVLSKIKVS